MIGRGNDCGRGPRFLARFSVRLPARLDRAQHSKQRRTEKPSSFQWKSAIAATLEYGPSFTRRSTVPVATLQRERKCVTMHAASKMRQTNNTMLTRTPSTETPIHSSSAESASVRRWSTASIACTASIRRLSRGHGHCLVDRFAQCEQTSSWKCSMYGSIVPSLKA